MEKVSLTQLQQPTKSYDEKPEVFPTPQKICQHCNCFATPENRNSNRGGGDHELQYPSKYKYTRTPAHLSNQKFFFDNCVGKA